MRVAANLMMPVTILRMRQSIIQWNGIMTFLPRPEINRGKYHGKNDIIQLQFRRMPANFYHL